MPSENQHNEQAAEIPNPMPESTDKHGENPARYLVERIEPDNGDGTEGDLLFARIRGLETIAKCRFWLGVERWLASQEDRDPRDAVVDALEEREAHLEEHGEGLASAGIHRDERNRRDADADTSSAAILVDEDGEEVPWSRQNGATVRASQ